jgi:PAS domain S-box-containing protein
MTDDGEEEQRLRETALKNIESIPIARNRAERELVEARDALRLRTEELEQQREWFQVALASIGDAVITTDVNAAVTFLNPVAESMTGWSTAEAKGQALSLVFRLVNEDTGEAVDNPVLKVLESGVVVELANHSALISRHGTHVSIEDSAAPIRDARGAVVGAVMVFHDVTRRRHAERARRASEEQLRAVFSQAAVGIAVTDLRGQFVDANRRFCDVLGYSLQELRERTFLELTHPDDLPMTQGEVRRLLAGQISNYALEKRYLRKDGTLVWSATTVTLLKDDSGHANRFIGIVDDITPRKLAEAVQAQLAAVVESSDDAIITKTLDGIITTWNPGAESIFGYTAQEMIGRPVTTLIPPDQVDEEPAILERLRRGERIHHYETVRRRKSGALINVSLSVAPLKDSSGKIIGASKIARDITRQKHAEAELQEQSRVLEVLEKTGRSISSHLDLQAVLQTVTDAATQLSGAQFGAFFYNVINESGESFLLYTLSGASREAFEKFGLPRNTPVFAPTFKGEGIVRSGDITKDARYGTMSPHRGMPQGHLPVRSYLAVPVILPSGEVVGGLFFGHPEPDVFTERAERLVAGIAVQAAIAMDNARLYQAAQREIASRERAEAELKENDRRKDEFLATLAHELRNPLAPIRQAALISKTATATEAQKRWSHDVISRQVQHMSLLLDDLLDISRVTRGTLELRMEMTELAQVVEAAIETARPLIDAKRHRVSLEMPPEPVLFAADPLRLAQVLANLLTNAAKYTDREGTIQLRAAREAEHVTISVVDTGIGIPAEHLVQVFHMFSQVKSSQDRSEGGLGIGLAIAKGLVELHGGTIEARSEGHARGSEFVVRLPYRTLPSSTRSAPSTASKEKGPCKRVLIADDNRDAAESLAILLRMEGHEVTVVHDGKEAIAAFDVLLPEIALLDIGMPELDGYEVARQVRQRSLGRAVTLVAITGWGQESDKGRALAAGFNHHFTKPVEPERVMELMQADRHAPQ